MTFEEIRAAVESKIAAFTDAPIAFDNVPNSPAVVAAMESKSNWLRLTIQHGSSFTAGMGQNPCTRRTGVVFIQIFTNRDIGSKPAMDLASALAAHIEHWQQGRLSTQAASLNRVGPQDGWYQVNVSCPFVAD